jgi:hypothetical protein
LNILIPQQCKYATELAIIVGSSYQPKLYWCIAHSLPGPLWSLLLPPFLETDQVSRTSQWQQKPQQSGSVTQVHWLGEDNPVESPRTTTLAPFFQYFFCDLCCYFSCFHHLGKVGVELDAFVSIIERLHVLWGIHLQKRDRPVAVVIDIADFILLKTKFGVMKFEK